MKFMSHLLVSDAETSLPSRGAWIEMAEKLERYDYKTSLPSRGAWIEMRAATASVAAGLRRSPRGERGLKS